MQSFISRTERTILAGAASAVTAVTLSLLVSGFLPADATLERSRAEELLARGERLQQAQMLNESRFHASSVTAILR